MGASIRIARNQPSIDSPGNFLPRAGCITVLPALFFNHAHGLIVCLPLQCHDFLSRNWLDFYFFTFLSFRFFYLRLRRHKKLFEATLKNQDRNSIDRIYFTAISVWADATFTLRKCQLPIAPQGILDVAW